jgi:hypothetical protein
MSTVLSALVTVGALAASGALLVQLAVSESRRSRQRAEIDRAGSSHPPPPVRAVQAVQPERTELLVRVAPPEGVTPLERVAAPPPAPVRPVVWAPTLSPGGAWLWTGSAWVPSWWGGSTVPPPPPYAFVRPPRSVRSHGCAAAFGVGCAVVLGLVALTTLAVLAAAAALASLVGG